MVAVNARPRPSNKDTQYPLYTRMERSHGRSGRVWKVSPTPEFDPRTVQLVVSRCIDNVILAHPNNTYTIIKISLVMCTPGITLVLIVFAYCSKCIKCWFRRRQSLSKPFFFPVQFTCVAFYVKQTSDTIS
jgi:hypothetical protein